MTQQKPDPYSQFQQPHNAPISAYTQPPPTPGQFQFPPSHNYNSPPKRPSGFRNWFRTRSRNTKIDLGCGTIIAALLLCICTVSACGSSTVATIPTPTPTTGHVTILNPPTVNIPTDTPTLPPTPTQKPTPTPTPQSIHYPPTTVADLRGLAAKGDVSAINEFHSESVGAVGVCPEPRKEVTVNSSVTGQQLAEDLLAYFYANQLDSPCGSLVLAYHNQGEAGDAYTAGRINFDVTDSSGAVNLDPNATNLKYTLTLDIGDFATGQEYVVTY